MRSDVRPRRRVDGATPLTWRSILVVFLVALAIGIAINAIRGERAVDDLTGDEPDYFYLASELAESGQYGVPGKLAFRAPGYPTFLAIGFRLFEPSVLVARVLQSILGAFLVVLAFALATSLSGQTAGRLAALMVMVESYWWLHQWSLMQENLLGVLLGVVVLFALAAQAADRTYRFLVLSALGGLSFGLSLLVKPMMVPLLGLVAVLPFLVPAGHRGRAWVGSGAFILVALLTLLPWTARNWSAFGQPVLLTTGSGRVFSGSHCPETFSTPGNWGRWIATEESFSAADSVRLGRLPPQEQELFTDRLRWHLGLQEIRRQSVSKLSVFVAFKWLRAGSPSTYFGADRTPVLIAKIGLALLNTLILVGFLGSVLRRTPGWWVGGILAVALLVTVTVFWGCIRFRYPLQPAIAGFSAVWWVSVLRNMKSTSG